VKTTALITLRAAGGGYELELTADDGKPQATGTIAADFGSPAGAIGAGVDGLRNALVKAQGPAPQLNDLGTHLFGLLTAGKLQQRWNELAQNPLRIQLAFEEPALRFVPWELMREGPLRLATREDRSLSRKVTGPAKPEAPIAWPLRVLVVVGSDDAVVAAKAELCELDEAFRSICGLVDLDVLHLPSAERIADVARKMRPHILHVITHGDDTEDAGPRLLMFDEKAGKAWRWTADRTAELLPRMRPRFVVLNACRTANPDERTAKAEQASTWGIADACLGLGVAAVLAMQGDISGPGAGAFSHGLYRALSEGSPVDEALTVARRAVVNRVGENHRDWALPVLTAAVPPQHILSTRSPLPVPVRRTIEDRIRGFIDRSEVRREVWSALALGCEEPQEADALAVVGSSKVGKSTLVSWCLDASALQGRNVAYVDLASDRHIPVLGVLGLIAEALAQSPHHGKGNREAFDDWIKSLDRLLGPKAMPPEPDGAMGRYYRVVPPKPPENAAARIFGSFKAALVKAAGDEPLILALDHLHDESLTKPAWESYLVPELLGPIANHDLPQVRLILVLADEERERRLVGPLAGLRPVPLGLFPRARMRELVRTRLLFEGFERARLDEWLPGVVPECPPNDWPPQRLKDTVNVANMVGLERVP
jgi:hypothetical protein